MNKIIHLFTLGQELFLGLVLIFQLSSTGRAYAQFTVQPVSVVQAEGLEAVFQCLYHGAHSYVWGFNGTLLLAVNVDPEITHTHPSGNAPAILTIPALPKYNNTVVQCNPIIEEENSSFFMPSNNVTLQVQGPHESVTNLYFNEALSSPTTVTISWSAPFSLDLTTADPDIQYCVEVYNVTGGGSHHLDSVCGITDTQYTYTAPDPAGVYNFTVTPRSNIQGSLIGTTSQPVEGYTIQMPVMIPAHEIDVHLNVGANSVDIDVDFALTIIEGVFPGSRPTSYTMELVFLDETLSSPCNCDATHVVRDGMVVLEDVDCTPYIISRHAIFNLSLVTHNSMGSSTSDPLEISTHDTQVQDVVYSNVMEQVVVNCSYLEGSQEVGFLLIVSSESGFNYGVVYREEGEEFTAVAINGTEGSRVLVYDLHSNIAPESLLATSRPARTTFTSSGFNIQHSYNSHNNFKPNVSVTMIDGTICLSCYSEDCMGIIHASHLKSSTDLTVVKYFVSDMNSTDKVCTEQDYLLLQGEFHIAVFGFLSNRLTEFPVYKNIIVQISIKEGTGWALVMPVLIITIAFGIIIIVVVCVIPKCKRCERYTLNGKRSTDHVLINAEA